MNHTRAAAQQRLKPSDGAMAASPYPMKKQMERPSTMAEQKSGDDSEKPVIDKAACRSRLVYRNSEQFRLMKRLFASLQPQHLGLTMPADRVAIRRLERMGLVKTSRVSANGCCCGLPHVMHSITFAGKAHVVASEHGLTFPQLCYLVCGRNAAKTFVIDGMPAFVDKDVDPIFLMVLRSVSPKVTRKELTRKGFLKKYVWHASVITPRLAELERHSEVLDKLHLWMRAEYESRLLQAIRNPAIARVVGLFQLPGAQS